METPNGDRDHPRLPAVIDVPPTVHAVRRAII
jgi:hypothetical protein